MLAGGDSSVRVKKKKKKEGTLLKGKATGRLWRGWHGTDRLTHWTLFVFRWAPSIHTFLISAIPTTLLVRRHLRPLCLRTASHISPTYLPGTAKAPPTTNTKANERLRRGPVANHDTGKLTSARPERRVQIRGALRSLENVWRNL